MNRLPSLAGSPALCAAGLAGMAYCHIRDVGVKFDEHVYYVAALFCGNIAASLALVPLVLLAGRLAPRLHFGIWAAAGTLAALTVAGFLWSRIFGVPLMSDHIGAWDALGLTSVGFEALVIAVSVRVVLGRTYTSRGAVALAAPHRIPRGARLWASTAGLLGAIGTVIALHHAPAPAHAGGCVRGAMACHAAPALRTVETGSAEKPQSRRFSIRTYTYYRGPIRTGDFATRWVDQQARHPRVNGFVIGMHAQLVDTATEHPISIAKAMLHHLFFTRVHLRGHETACRPLSTEIFYSTGEEDETSGFRPGTGTDCERRTTGVSAR